MSTKRLRTTSTVESLCINDLPDGILLDIASYLAKPSAALFTMALSQEKTQTSKAIISSTNWNVLDFNDIEKSLAAKLSDGDIDKILRSIDAVNNLKILKIAGCVNITGSGLDVLRLSTTLEQIDLSLVGQHESPWIEQPEPNILESLVIPILGDIISRGRASCLKQLELPKKWKQRQSTQLHEFLDRYNDYLESKKYGCSQCDRVCVMTGRNEWISRDRDSMEEREWDWYGTQNYTCTKCVQHFCNHEECVDENEIRSTWCKKCQKEFCHDCVSMTQCDVCNDTACNICEVMKACGGEDCESVLCEECYEKKTCSYCKKTRCDQCVRSYRCKSDDCPNAICRDCEIDIHDEGIRAYGWCWSCKPF